jgi:cytosine/adenosine deaminase-related metal-dependent hydrolase
MSVRASLPDDNREAIMKTVIKGGHIVAYDGSEHRLIRDGTVTFEDDRIIHVGKHHAGEVDATIDAGGKLVCPGFINLHTHLLFEAGGRYMPDVGRTDLFGNTYFNYQLPLPGRKGYYEGERADLGGRYAALSVLKSGATTVVDCGISVKDPERLVDVLGEIGIRAYIAPSFRSAETIGDAQGRIVYDWNEEKGMQGLDRAIRFIKRFDGAHNARIRGMIVPMQADTCSEKLLREAKTAASDLGVRIQIHTAQNVREFMEIIRTRRKTPVEFLSSVGLLGPEVTLAHCIIVSGHSWANYPFGDDLKIISDAGSSVAHCPIVFARRGLALESFAEYLKTGINMGIGTDSYPNDILDEMRVAYLTCKLAEKSFAAGSCGQIFNAATLGGARALGRDDLGRIAPGAKADITIVDLCKLHFGPIRDPIKALVILATGQDVDTVIVDGRTLFQDGQVVGIDEQELLKEVQDSAEKAWAMAPEMNWDGKSLDEVSPMTFKLWE